MSRWVLFGALVLVLSGHTTAREPGVQYEPELLVQLAVSDLDRAIAFYTDTLGFELTERRDDLHFAHLASHVPGVEFGLHEAERPSAPAGVVLNISVADVAVARAVLERRGVVFDGPTTVIPRKVVLAGFTDPDGHRLRLAGPPPR